MATAFSASISSTSASSEFDERWVGRLPLFQGCLDALLDVVEVALLFALGALKRPGAAWPG